MQKDPSGNCAVTVNGTFKRDSAPGITHFADLQLNITLEGTYSIASDTVNGFSFHGAGVAEKTGVQTVHLYATGKPVAAGVFEFTVQFGESICKFFVPVTRGAGAAYTFEKAGNNCLLPVLAGTYTSGFVVTAANTVALKVIVTETGDYNIATQRINGVLFSGHGTFAATGNTTVLLTADGTPAASSTPVTASYTAAELSGPVVSCAFDVTYAATGNATYTIDCANTSIYWLFNQYDPIIPQSKVYLFVTVTVPGLYNISAVNGNVTFTSSGIFQTTAPGQVITLTGTGTSPVSGDVIYQTTGGPVNDCQFTVPWKFLKAKIGNTLNYFNYSLRADYDYFPYDPGINYMHIDGHDQRVIAANDLTNKQFEIAIGSSDPGILPTGTYSIDDASPYKIEVYYGLHDHYYSAKKDGTTHTNPFIINVTSSTADRMKGTFSGRITNSSGETKEITDGEFDTTVFYP